MHNTRYAAKRNSGGFAILEALVGLLVLAFGMLALAAFQSTLSLQSDIAKQRSEATRLAQRQIDRLRAFNQRGADGTPGGASLTYVEDVVTPADFTVTSGHTNTTFTVSTAVTVPTGDRYRWLRVAVNWLDRTGATRDVVMNTVVSDGDPGDLGALGVGRTKSTTLRPKNRNINIPYPAVTLSGGQLSAFVPPPGNVVYVFDNSSGNVVQRCVTPSPVPIDGGMTRSGNIVTALATGHPFHSSNTVTIAGASAFNGTFTVTSSVLGTSFTYVLPTPLPLDLSATGGNATLVINLVEGLNLATSGLTCTTLATQAYLLSGYVRFKTSGAAPTAANIDDPSDLTDPTLPLLPDDPATTMLESPLTIDTSATISNVPSTYECYSQRQLTVRNNSTGFELTIAEGATVPAGYSASGAPRFIAYTCIVTPPDDGDGNALTLNKWSGEVKLVALSTGADAWSIGTGSGQYRVCRATGDYNRNGFLSNHEHPRYYRHVTGALDNQNYLVINGTDSCPPDVNSNPLTGDFVNTNTATHQPSVDAVLSFWCGNAACSGSNKNTHETLPAGDPIPME